LTQLDENRLIQYNGDLTGRVTAVDADAWREGELREVIAKGEGLLNVRFDSEFVDALIESSFDSVWVIQEACYRACVEAGVHFTAETTQSIGEGRDAAVVARAVVDTQSARYNSFISGFAGGFMQTALEMYRWLLLPVLTTRSEELERGLSYTDIRNCIDAHHPSTPINPGNMTQALKSAAPLQVKLNIKPIILDYNQSRRRLDVVDRSFLIWLKHQDINELLAAADLPEIA
jgi:hypothetical protein